MGSLKMGSKHRHLNIKTVFLVVLLGSFLVYILYSMSNNQDQHVSNDNVDPIITCQPGDYVDTSFIKEVKRNETVYIPETRVLESLTREELAALYHRYIENQQYLCKRRVRLGSIEDGGWDICDDNQFRPTAPCLVYSFGINNDFTFDDAVAKFYGCEVHSFDPSMAVGDHKRNELSYFHALGISDKDEVTDDKWQLLTYNSIREKLGHDKKPISVLKMDVETYEWQVVADILNKSDLSKTSNLVIEFHLALSSPEQERDSYLRAVKLFGSLYKSGYRIFWTHQNKWCKFISKCKHELRTNCHEVNFVRVKS